MSRLLLLGGGVLAIIIAVIFLAGVGVLIWWFTARSVRRSATPVPTPDLRAPTAPAGWYSVEGGRRYWNGSQWTTPTIPG